MRLRLSEQYIIDKFWPECFLCKKPVEKFVSENNLINRTTLFAALCHGDKQIVEIDPDLFNDAKVSKSYAFMNHKIEKL